MCSTISTSPRFRNTFSENSSTYKKEWRGRSRTGKGATWLSNAIPDSPMPLQLIAVVTILASHVHNETLSIRLGEAEAAAMFGKSRSQAARYLDALEKVWNQLTVRRGDLDEFGGYLPNLYTLNSIPTKRPQAVPKSVDSESKNDPTPRVMDESRLLIKNYSLSTSLQETPPYPPQAGDMCVNIQNQEPTLKPKPHQPEPQRPIPDPEVWQAQQQAREFREQRRARKDRTRRDHYAKVQAAPRLEGRSRRHHEPLTPVQQAAVEVLMLLGVAVPRERLRRAIEGALELHSRRWGLRPALCVERLVLAWAEYQSEGDRLYCAVGIERFYGEGIWDNRASWRYDRDVIDRMRPKL